MVIINGLEYEAVVVDRTNNIVGITEQVEELFCPKNLLTQQNLLNEIFDNMCDTFYVDECGQIFVISFCDNLKYIGKCKL
jgi:hypothetical protein